MHTRMHEETETRGTFALPVRSPGLRSAGHTRQPTPCVPSARPGGGVSFVIRDELSSASDCASGGESTRVRQQTRQQTRLQATSTHLFSLFLLFSPPPNLLAGTGSVELVRPRTTGGEETGPGSLVVGTCEPGQRWPDAQQSPGWLLSSVQARKPHHAPIRSSPTAPSSPSPFFPTRHFSGAMPRWRPPFNPTCRHGPREQTPRRPHSQSNELTRGAFSTTKRPRTRLPGGWFASKQNASVSVDSPRAHDGSSSEAVPAMNGGDSIRAWPGAPCANDRIDGLAYVRRERENAHAPAWFVSSCECAMEGPRCARVAREVPDRLPVKRCCMLSAAWGSRLLR